MKKFEIISTCIGNAVRRNDLNPKQLGTDKGANRPVHRHQNSGRQDCDSKFLLQTDEMAGKGETGGYKEAMEHILKELGKLKMEE